MADSISVNSFAAELMKICSEYADSLGDKSVKLVDDTAKEAVTKLSKNSPRGKSIKHYADNWTKRTSKKNGEASSTVYNKKYQLTHLLEKGHALRQGGRSPAKVHIKPVEEEMVDKFQKEAIKLAKSG